MEEPYDDVLPPVETIDVETHDLYRHDEEQAYLTLMSQHVKPINFAAEPHYTVRLCKNLLAHHYPQELPIGSFELLASNKIRSDDETLADIFNGDTYYTDKPDADDPDYDWVPRKEQVFSDHMLMQLSIWKKDWNADTKSFEPIDLSYMPYGRERTLEWKRQGLLDERNVLRPESELIAEGKITDPDRIDEYNRRQRTVATLRERHLVRERDALEAVEEIADGANVEEALDWLRRNKEKEYAEAARLTHRRDELGEQVDVEEGDRDADDPEVQVYECEPPELMGFAYRTREPVGPGEGAGGDSAA